MSQYKILVRNAEEVEKAQTLFEKLGFRKGECTLYDLPKLIVTQTNEPHFGTYSSGASLTFDCKNKYEWLSMEQLEGLVNHLNDLEDSESVAQSKSNEQGLISGADALIAIGKGERVQYSFDDDKCWQNDIANLKITDFGGGHYAFRLKPRTVKLEIEVPAPFEPKVGEKYFFLSSNGYGYDETTFSNDDLDKEHLMYGAWRTETEIKIVVEQLSKLGVLK